MSDGPFRRCGKQVLRGSEHYADAVSEDAAEMITVALNFCAAARTNEVRAAARGEGRLARTFNAKPHTLRDNGR